MFFNKYKNQIIKVAECSFMKISTGDVVKYFKYLKDNFSIYDLDYDVENKKGDTRCIIKTYRGNIAAINYFDDRCCPAIIESEIKMCINMYVPVDNSCCYNIDNPDLKNYKVLRPVITMLPIANKGIVDYTSVLDGKTPTKVKFSDGTQPYDSLPYVYKFRLSIPEDTPLELGLNKYGIKKFFVESFSSKFNSHILEEEIVVKDVKDTLFPRCIEFYLYVDPDPNIGINEFLQKIDVDDPKTQIDNELNIKLKIYLGFPI